MPTLVMNDVEVQVGQPSVMPVELEVAAGSEQVEVTASAVMTQLDSAAAGTLINTQQ